MKTFLAVVICLTFGGCNNPQPVRQVTQPEQPTQKSTLEDQSQSHPVVIVFDDWWNVDYVKNGCEYLAQFGKTCTRSAKETVNDFENEVDVAFSTENACHGLVLLHFTPEMAQAAAKNPSAPATGKMLAATETHWSLMLDLDGTIQTQAGQGWSLVDSSNNVLKGEITTPKRLVEQVCKIVKGVGGVAK